LGYQGFHAADADCNLWCLGVQKMATKGREIVLSTCKQFLSVIDNVSIKENKKSEEILLNITSTLSDRSATQIKSNQLLEDFRSKIVIGQIGEAWNTFSESQRSCLTKMCIFFATCTSLHGRSNIDSFNAIRKVCLTTIQYMTRIT
jgi:hypothetical protein